MKKVIFFLMIGMLALLSYIVNNSKPRAQALAPDAEYASPIATPTFVPTRTIVPSATIGYESTLMIAQATADEARRVNAQVTSEAEQRILSYAQLTADESSRQHEVAMWTQIAGSTIIPLTATAQVVANTQIAESQKIVAAGYTAQANAPTQMYVMAQAQAVERFATINQWVELIAMGTLILFLLSGVALFTRLPMAQVAEEEPDVTETTVWIRNKAKNNGAQSVLRVVPCSPEQLTELAELAINGEKKFGINRLEQTSRTFRYQRETLISVRQFLVENKFVIPDNNGTITLNDDGEAFLQGWFDTHQLNAEYGFAPDPEPQAEPEKVEEV